MITGPFTSSDTFELPLLSVLPDQKIRIFWELEGMWNSWNYINDSINYNVTEYLPDSGAWEETTIIEVKITPISIRWKF